ncbi:MAG TPA: hypothetical protein VGO36_06025 [Solirubrobacterales bacterium]|jgi:hypothetical protein|nr:hypothetical protein [Solirubrobacterales bacterium]
MTPLATEAIWAVFGGLIPIVGAVAVALILWRAVRDNPSDDDKDK